MQSESLPARRDVVILGSGITGCSVARWVLSGSSSLSITVLEARTLCSGATGRNGGHIKCVPVTDYVKLRQQMGHDAAAQVVRFVMAHYGQILACATELGAADVGEVRPVTAVTVACEPTKVKDLRDAHTLFENSFPEYRGVYNFYEGEEAREKLGLQTGYAAMTGPAGAAWPYRMITAIYRALLVRHGDRFSIETSTPALRVVNSADFEFPYQIETNRGTILAKRVVYCVEAHTSHLLPHLRGLIFPVRGQMTLQKSDTFPVSRSGFSWSFVYSNSFDYMCQNAKTGELFLGGGGVLPEEGDYEHLANPSDASQSLTGRMHLRGVIASLFGGESPSVKATWSGVMGFSLDGLPLVGKLPTRPFVRSRENLDLGEWIAAGFGGYGMVNSWLSGKALAEQILGHGVPSWFPEAYTLTNERWDRLDAFLSSKMKSGGGFRSLL